LEGLISSTRLWKGCCVGVAADTEAVDELCKIESAGAGVLTMGSVHTMVAAVLSSDVH
jgi:hypothetical protein